MGKKRDVRLHRFGIEIVDPKRVRKFRDLLARHVGIIEAKRRADPLATYEMLNLSELILRVIDLGLAEFKRHLDESQRHVGVRLGEDRIV
jgi:hypothetical protein